MRSLTLAFLILLLVGCGSDVSRFGFNQDEWQSLSWADKKQIRENYKVYRRKKMSANSQETPIELSLLSGQARFWPSGEHAYIKPTKITLSPGTCEFWLLEAKSDTQQVIMKVCDDGKRIWLDPDFVNHKNSIGSIIIPRNKSLQMSGFVYQPLMSRGYAQLIGAAVMVREHDDM